MNNQRVGLWLIGACGGVGTTAVLGLAAMRRRLLDPTGMVTALPLFTALDLDPVEPFVIGAVLWTRRASCTSAPISLSRT